MKIDYRPQRAGWKRLYGCGVCGGDWVVRDGRIICAHCGHVKWVQRIDTPPLTEGPEPNDETQTES